MSTPAFVQANTNYQTSGTAVSVLLASAPTSGNLLVAYLFSGATVTTPAGWTLAHSEYYSSHTGYTFYKTSNGTETGFSATLSTSNYASTIITEWSGADFGAFTEINHISTPSPATFGPSSAPISASSIPLVFVSFNSGQKTLTPGSPWTGQASQSGTTLDQSGYYHEAAPNAAATLTLTLGGGGPSASQSIIIWIDPGAAPSGDTGSSATTDAPDVSSGSIYVLMTGVSATVNGLDISYGLAPTIFPLIATLQWTGSYTS